MSYDELMQVLGALESKVGDLSKTIQRLKMERDQTKEELSKIQRNNETLQKELKASQNRVHELESQIQAGDTNAASQHDENREEIRQRIHALVEKISRLEE